MQGRSLPVILVLLAMACGKDAALPEPDVPSAPDIEHGYSMEEIVGTYHGQYAYEGSAPLPPPGSSFSYSDTIIEVTQDTVGGDPWIRAGYQSFGVHEDGTLDPYFNTSVFEGRFNWIGDTLHLEWESHWSGDFGDYTHSSFSGKKQ